MFQALKWHFKCHFNALIIVRERQKASSPHSIHGLITLSFCHHRLGFIKIRSKLGIACHCLRIYCVLISVCNCRHHNPFSFQMCILTGLSDLWDVSYFAPPRQPHWEEVPEQASIGPLPWQLHGSQFLWFPHRQDAHEQTEQDQTETSIWQQ